MLQPTLLDGATTKSGRILVNPSAGERGLRLVCQLLVVVLWTVGQPVLADEQVLEETGAAEVKATSGLSGQGVTLVVIGDGLDILHPDFRTADGESRVRAILDARTAEAGTCSPGEGSLTEYSQAQIRRAVRDGRQLAPDLSGQGTLTAGLAAGNGLSVELPGAGGLAPRADLVVVRIASQAACMVEVLDWVEAQVERLAQPAVAVLGFGDFGPPVDGSSRLSRKLDSLFSETPGRVLVAPSGSLAKAPIHARGRFGAAGAGEVEFRKQAGESGGLTLWYDGEVPAEITVHLADGSTVGPAAPGATLRAHGVAIEHRLPGGEGPHASGGPDRSVSVQLDASVEGGRVSLRSLTGASASFDAYVHAGFVERPSLELLDDLVSGNVPDAAATRSAIVAGSYVLRTSYIDIDGELQRAEDEASGTLATESGFGPTRDGRRVVTVAAPGYGSFAPVSSQAAAARQKALQPREGNGHLMTSSDTLAAAGIVAGAAALLLEQDPGLTSEGLRDLLERTARLDEFTGDTPPAGFGAGKLDLRAAASQLACDAGQALCLSQERFSVQVSWTDFSGNSGSGQVVPFQSADSGLFWFFSADNWEMMVKILDGCSLNDHFWVFAAATTDVEYTLTVTDTLTNESKSYSNPLGTASPALTDTEALRTCDGARPHPSIATPAQSLGVPADIERHLETLPQDSLLPCSTTDNALCLNGDRFLVEAEWKDFQGNEGVASVVPFGSDDSGLFWFFNEDNWEMLIKVLDGCALNNHYWIFAAATTNVEYTLKVTDTSTGTVRSYSNPLGTSAAALTDTQALPVCDFMPTDLSQDPNIRGLWRFDEDVPAGGPAGQVETRLDSSPAGNHLNTDFDVTLNTVDFREGVGSADFPGTRGAHLDRHNPNGTLDPPFLSADFPGVADTDYTVGGWILLRDLRTTRIIDSQVLRMEVSAMPELRMIHQESSGKRHFAVLPGTPLMNEWMHLTVRFDRSAPDGEKLALFLDGQLVATATTNPPDLRTNTQQFSFGSDLFGNGALNGLMDEMFIFNRPLTDQEIREIPFCGVDGSGC